MLTVDPALGSIARAVRPILVEVELSSVVSVPNGVLGPLFDVQHAIIE